MDEKKRERESSRSVRKSNLQQTSGLGSLACIWDERRSAKPKSVVEGWGGGCGSGAGESITSKLRINLTVRLLAVDVGRRRRGDNYWLGGVCGAALSQK